MASCAAARDGRWPVLRAIAVLALALLAHAASAAPNERVALLIGNNAYPGSALRSAVNDARDLAAALKELGFRTIVRENATRSDMIDAIRQFGQAIEGAEVALFFFAGHAIQYKERNYLIPVDAQMGTEDDVTFFSVEVAQVFDRMDRARTRFNLLVLDACRNNPFAASFKVSTAGLAQMSAPSGTLIAYATAPGSIAADGYGRNGTYTKHILQHIAVPDLPVEIMFKRVREGVERETLMRQTPWDSSSLKGDLIFNAATRASAPAAGGPSADMQLQIEREYWVSVRDSTRVEDVEAYLAKYPGGTFAALARNKLEAMLRPVRATAAGEPPRTTVPAAVSQATAAAQSPPSAGARAEAAIDRSAQPAATVVSPSAATTRPLPAAVTVSSPSPPAEPPATPSTPRVVAEPPPQPSEPVRAIAPGIAEIVFDNGAVYRGGVVGDRMHGSGEYVANAFRYEGEFRGGRRHGRGTYRWASGDRYEGEFADDHPNGSGTYVFASGDRYEGGVSAGVIAGRGTYASAGGDVFEGTFVHGKPDGVGIYRFANGDRYEGAVAGGRPNGAGRYFTRSGDRIEATFVDGVAQGKGTCHFANGDRYEGDFRSGMLTGIATYHYASGLAYQGEVAQGRPSGRGTFHFVDGSRFEGVFEDGLARARGEIVQADGARARAEIVDGRARLLD